MATVLRIFAYTWGGIAAFVVLIGDIGVIMDEGFTAWQDLRSPFNIWNSGLILLIFLPALAAYKLSQKLEEDKY
tara:strand:+ start:264 stop:485 length:222 start_codon:yes stop_codon:yes gene_type:complete